jgi:diguanylate cyclase (GGDEF)-like protein/PAS domain S-box-containing protein
MTAKFKENQLIYIAVIVYLIWVSVFVGTNYFSEKDRLYRSLDVQLDTAAASLPLLLPESFHHQSMQPGGLTQQQSLELTLKLSDFTRIRDVIYFYSLVLRDGKVYFTASSATDEEIEAGEGGTYYFDPYDDVDPGVFEVFRSEQKAYLEYTDQWGTFRSVFIPLRSPDGTLYVTAADIEISHIQDLLRRSLLRTLGVAALFLLFAIPLMLAFSVATRRLAKKLELRVQERTEELVNNEATLSSILELSPVGIVYYDASGKLIKVNKEFEAIVGFKREQLLGLRLKECQENEGIIKAVDESLAGRRGLFEGNVDREGQQVTLHAQFVPMVSATDTVVGGVAVIEDCTEQHEALLSLQKLSMAVENSPSVVFVTDRKGNIEYANSRFVEVTGYTDQEVIGKNPRILNSGTNDAELYQHLWSELLKGNHWSGEFQNRRKNGELYWVRQNIAPIFDKSNAITHFVAIQEDITEARRINEQNAYHATHDMLTGLVNRYEFERRLDRVIDTAKQGGSSHAMCFVDLDQFKIINDTCGHVAGDALLRYLAAVLREKLRVRDTLARIGGDEFALLLEHCDSEQALRAAESVHQIIDQFVFSWEGHNFTIGSSIGLTRIDQHTADAVEVLKRADAACYMAKEQGRNRIHVYRDDDESLAHREGEMQWVNVLKRALEKDDFVLYAQVIEATEASDSETSYEILVRLAAGDGSLVPPGSFLPAAERYDLSAALDRWVIEHTLEWLEANLASLGHVHHFAINLSGQSLGDELFLNYLQNRLQKTSIPAGILCFEITETAAIANLSTANKFIKTLRDHGCHFSLDDFGSGLSSFAYLKNLPVDYLKIDGMFVKGIIDDPIDEAMVKSINDIGQIMKMATVAEFVENDAIRERLKEIGVDFVQGYGVGMPVPLADILDN